MNLLIKNGRVIDPANGLDKIADILIENGKIKEISNIKSQISNIKVIDATNKIITPGLIDIHTHLREPGQENKETIATGTKSAAAGGFTTIACMPNTNPPIDNSSRVWDVLDKITHDGVINVFPIGAVSTGMKHKELVDVEGLINAGVVAISDDGYPVMDIEFAQKILEMTKKFGIPYISHCEDITLSKDGVMNEGDYSAALKLPGIPKSAEEVMVARNLNLAKITDGKLHIAHVSTKRSVELIHEAKEKGVKVTCEVCPHHFTLTDEAVNIYDTNTKMNPPLRSQEDVEAIKQGLKDGIIDVIASDHAPHTPSEKATNWIDAPFGIIGLETSLGLVLTELVHTGVLSLYEAIAKITINPAKVLGLEAGTLMVGRKADITIIDLEKDWIVDVNKFESKARNCPFDGWKLKGKAVMTIVGGKVIMERL